MNANVRRTERKHSFRPRLEALENRWCPAVTMAVLEGHILEVLGDDGDNVIEFHQRGSEISLMGDDAPMQTVTGIDSIRLNTWAGRDNVRIDVETQPSPDSDFSFFADLGTGDDMFSVAFDVPPGPCMPADVIAPTARIAVTGADGNDTFRTLVAGPEPGSAANLGCLHLNLALNNWGENGNDVFLTNVANVSLDGAVAISMAGGRGDDMFLTSLGNVAINAPMTLMNDGGLGGDNIALICGFNPQPDPPAMPGVIVNAPVDVMLDGGLGGDNIAAICGFNPQPDPPAFPAMQVMSRFHLDELGGNGNDMLTGIFLPAVQRGGSFMAMCDGGDGHDMVTGILLPAMQRGGMLDAAFLGGAGDDVVNVNVNLFGFTPESGQVHVAVDGGDGSDHLMFRVLGAERPMENVMLTLDGGAGEDFALVSALVRFMNCEHVEMI